MIILLSKIKNSDILNRILNKIYIKIGLFVFLEIESQSLDKEVDSYYVKKILDVDDKILLMDYASKYRSNSHYIKNILPRIEQENRFKAFAVIDELKNEIAYLCWIDFENITIPEIGYLKKIESNEAYFLDDHCVKHHQGKGLHSLMFNERLLFCKRKKVSNVFIVIYLNNFKALGNLKKFNFKLLRRFIFYPLMKL